MSNVIEHGLTQEAHDALMAKARAMKDKIGAPAGDKIRLTRKKTFVLPDGKESADPLRVVVLDFMSYNAFFDRPFSEKDKIPPACFAIGSDPKNLVPSENSPDKQSGACKGCPNNEFGSKGNGKACGNHRILAVVAPDGDENSPMFTIATSPTASKYWDAYVAEQISKNPLGLLAVSTEIFFGEEDFPTLRFGRPEANQFVGVHAKRVELATQRLLREPDVSNYVAPPKPGDRKAKK